MKTITFKEMTCTQRYLYYAAHTFLVLAIVAIGFAMALNDQWRQYEATVGLVSCVFAGLCRIFSGYGSLYFQENN